MAQFLPTEDCPPSGSLQHEPTHGDGEDYTMIGERAWITVGDLCVSISANPNGINVEILPASLNECGAFFPAFDVARATFQQGTEAMYGRPEA